MKVVTTSQMVEIDRLAMEEFEIPGELLMERAGLGVAQVADELSRLAGYANAGVRLVAGKGNNGGDVFVAARHLKQRGYPVEVFLAGRRGQISGDALKHFERMRQEGISVTEAATPEDWEGLLRTEVGIDGLVVDGVLGTGIRGPARGAAAGAIQFVNAHSSRSPVVSVDIPSGLDSDTGEAEGDVVVADITVTMALPKSGLLVPDAVPYVGSIEVIDIGMPPELLARFPGGGLELVAAEDCRGLVRRRERASHKGSYGHVLIVGGSVGFSGAVVLAARAALRSGAGLVSVAVPEGVHASVAASIPEAMVHPLRDSGAGTFHGRALHDWERNLDDFDCVVIGPGLSVHEECRALVLDAVQEVSSALVLDADALNVLRGNTGCVATRSAPTLLTPHPGEMSRLMGLESAQDVQSARQAVLSQAVETLGADIILKGAGSLICGPGASMAVSMVGNPGMARGGMGDALAGLAGGLIAQGMSCNDAARLSVYLHGRAGDRVAWMSSQAGMTPSDLICELPNVFAELSPR